jgi:uncharacterized protein (TIGR01777 family)
MKILVTGATGFIGRHLVAEAKKRGHAVVAASRDAAAAKAALGDVDVVAWDPMGGPLPPVPGVEGVVHLAGENVGKGRWTRKKMMRIVDSRVVGTRNLVAGLKANPPKAFAGASAIGWYGPHGDEEITEADPHGEDFLANVCVEWEREARHAGELGATVAIVRIGIVLGRGGGALQEMLTPFKWCMGGPIAGGAQWMSWVHIDDVAGVFLHALEKGIHGTLNATAPGPATNREFSKTLGRVLGRPAFMPMPGFMLRIIVGKFAQVLTTGQRVLPKQTTASGYAFKWTELEAALKNCVEQQE